MTLPAVCLAGFGEVGQLLANDLRARGVGTLSAWDLRFTHFTSVPGRGLADRSAADALSGAAVVISAATAAECSAATRTAAAARVPGTSFRDIHSVSPKTKFDAAGPSPTEAAATASTKWSLIRCTGCCRSATGPRDAVYDLVVAAVRSATRGRDARGRDYGGRGKVFSSIGAACTDRQDWPAAHRTAANHERFGPVLDAILAGVPEPQVASRC